MVLRLHLKQKQINDVLYYGRKEALEEKAVKHFFGDMLSGVDYLHYNRIAHRDLKLDNCLLSDTWRVLIIDFGFSVIVPLQRESMQSTAKQSEDVRAIICSLEPLYLASVLGNLLSVFNNKLNFTNF